MGSSTAQDHPPAFCGVCSIFQEMANGNFIEETEETERQIYLWHLRREHGVSLRSSEEVLTR